MRIVALLALAPLAGFVPYEHAGYAVVPFDGATVEGQALFSSEVSEFPTGVLIRVTFAVPGGGEGFLVIDMPLVPIGQQAPARFAYYEKIAPDRVSFEATTFAGAVVVADRFEGDGETSLRLDLDLTAGDGKVTRTLANATLVTAPSPAVLRTNGALPPGIVLQEGHYVGGAGYTRGEVTCVGSADDPYVEVYDDPEDYPEPEDDDDDYYDDSDATYDDTSSGPDCSDDTGDTGDSSSDDSGCVGDAEAAPPGGRAAASRPPPPLERVVARRIQSVSPLLLAIAAMLLLRARGG